MNVTHKELKTLMKRSFEVKKPLFVWGPTGIGKSMEIKAVASEVAKDYKREYIEWNRLSEHEKLEFKDDTKDLKDYLILVDDRVSLKDNTDNKGIPNLTSEYLKWVKTLIMNLSSRKGAMVIFFKDEMNLAPPSVQAAEYQIILDRALDDLSFSDDVYVLAAGNRAEDKANVFEMGAPLKNRFAHCTLTCPTAEEWTEWALRNGIDERIIGFINFAESHLWKWSSDLKDVAFPTPRKWADVSAYIKDVNSIDLVRLYASSNVGDGTATEFVKFVEIGMKINLDDYLKNPEKLKAITKMDVKYALLSSGIERYRKKPEILPELSEFINYFNPEFSIYLLKMIRGTDDAIDRPYFKNNIRKCNAWKKIMKDYAQFLT